MNPKPRPRKPDPLAAKIRRASRGHAGILVRIAISIEEIECRLALIENALEQLTARVKQERP